ncbi:Spore germination protein B1 [compost metagenome]
MWSRIVTYIPDWTTFLLAGFALLIPLIFWSVHRWLYSMINNQYRSKKTGPMDSSDESSVSRLTGDYTADLELIKQAIGNNCDVHFREFLMGRYEIGATLIFVNGMQAEEHINSQVMQILMMVADKDTNDKMSLPPDTELSTYIKQMLLPLSEINEVVNVRDLNQSILNGHLALLIDGMPNALVMSMLSIKSRSITEPTSEALLRGPRIGFTEQLSENTSMLRRQGSTENLEMTMFEVGNYLKRNLVIAYMKDIVNPDLLQEVKQRISKMDMDYFAESGYVEQLIEDSFLSPFQQGQNTERPDRVISALLEGRVGILLDGTPFALIVPVTFSMLLQSPEDYYERWIPGTLLRILRFIAAFLALMAPALYISFISFHPGLIPTELAISIIESRQGVPFPSLIEVLVLEISIEILREAGIRLPKPIGPAMGIVGGLIIGDAAVQAGIVSPFLVIVVAVTAISSFSIPMYSAGITLRILRFMGMLFAAVLGMYGTVLFFLLLCSHLAKLKSFGVPYITPISPFRMNDWKDLLLRAPLPLMKRRPDMMKTQQKQRRS